MLLTISRAIKRRAPRVHEAVKKNWRLARLPLPKILMGNLVWIDSRLLGAEVTETHVLRWIRESLRPGDTFFDVGAHRGWMSLVAAKRVGPRGRAVAFEPSPPLVDVLRYHQRVNRMRQDVGKWNIYAGHALTGPIRISAETVFVCAGAVQTPALLRRSGITRKSWASIVRGSRAAA